MKALQAHRGWLLALVAAIVFMACSHPLLDYVQQLFEQRLGSIETRHRLLEASLQQLRDDAATAERLRPTIDAEALEKNLAAVDRLSVTSQFESLAASARLDHFAYTLSPETPFKNDADAQGLARSTLSIEAQAPNDIDAIRFVDRLLRLLPGRAELQRFSLDRLNDGEAKLGALNVHVNIAIDWIANESKKAGDS
jgi:hypothetical protein